MEGVTAVFDADIQELLAISMEQEKDPRLLTAKAKIETFGFR